MKWRTIKDRIFGQSAPAFSANRKIQTCALFSAGAMGLLNLIRIYDFIINPDNTGLPLSYTLILLGLFIGLWLLARAGKPRLSAWLLIASYSLPAIYCFYFWGADLPAGILMAVLIAVMAGMFLGSKQALLVMTFFAALIIALTHLQYYLVIPISSSWRLKPNQPADALVYTILFAVIYLLAWIILRDNRRALRDTEEARQALHTERDLLEIKVIERTQAITEMQREKIERLQVLASIGQLSGGIFHDIVNPLTAVNLNLEQLKGRDCPDMDESQEYLQQALAATNRIKDLVGSVNSCLKRQEKDRIFSVEAEISKIRAIMAAKARSQNTVISVLAENDIKLCGDPTRFSQIIMNLIGNALDACAGAAKEQRIDISCKQTDAGAVITVTDTGSGISTDNLSQIFNSFFTTKKNVNHNLGLGLSIVKEIVETDFKGKIEVASRLDEGTTFTICLPSSMIAS